MDVVECCFCLHFSNFDLHTRCSCSTGVELPKSIYVFTHWTRLIIMFITRTKICGHEHPYAMKTNLRKGKCYNQ